jgi:hypothetical protein
MRIRVFVTTDTSTTSLNLNLEIQALVSYSCFILHLQLLLNSFHCINTTTATVLITPKNSYRKKNNG